ncbi:MAG: tetratricopeptide repeat-containing glycosyltransferase family protein [Alphaproteobacteria bacterium]
MVRLCPAGGRLTQTPPKEAALLHEKRTEAARLHAKGDIAAASVLYRDVLKIAPQDPDALHMMGIIAQQGGNQELAVKFFEMALAVNPDFAGAWYNRALVLRVMKRGKDALQSVQAAIEIDPTLGEAWNLMALLLKDDGAHYDQARECHIRAIALQPKNPQFHDNYAALLLAMEDREGAYLAARKAQEISPSYRSMSMGTVLHVMGYPALAAEYLAYPNTLFLNDADMAVTEAMTRLQIGDFDRGWALWEQRTCFPNSLGHIPFWQGEKVTCLYLYEDQGMGDAIQFLRYISLLKTRAESLVLCLRAPLKTLGAESFPGVKIIVEGAPVPDAPPSSACYRLTSLPTLFKTRLDNIPPAPYLTASESRRAFWRDKLRDLPTPRIGLVWAGGAHFRNDAGRSVTFSTVQPVTSCGAQHFVSLQKERAEDRGADIFDATPHLHDFADTAALIAELDLVITVDTSVAHLAGALGKPVWILLAFNSDWRWFLGREDSPWYPTARLFRQKKPGDWAEVIDRVKGEVQKLIAGDLSVLQPPPWDGQTLRQNPYALPLPL